MAASRPAPRGRTTWTRSEARGRKTATSMLRESRKALAGSPEGRSGETLKQRAKAAGMRTQPRRRGGKPPHKRPRGPLRIPASP